MIHVTYSRNGIRYNWLSCSTKKSLLKWLKALGDITDIYITVT